MHVSEFASNDTLWKDGEHLIGVLYRVSDRDTLV